MTDDALRNTLLSGLLRLWTYRAERAGATAVHMERLQVALRRMLDGPPADHGQLRFSDSLPETRFISDLFPDGLPLLSCDRELAASRVHADHVKLAGSLIVGRSSAIRSAVETALRLAPTEIPVLLCGETGVGKERFAELIHRTSHVCSGPFVSVNCAAMPEPLILSELFGYEPGAFTGAALRGRKGRVEAAHGGTLFLDEIGDLPPAGQAALLRFLDSGEIQKIGRSRAAIVHTRLICATHVDLSAAVAVGAFRRDLYYRIALVPLRVPPLRERIEDIPLLSAHFLTQFRSRYRREHPDAVTPEALHRLRDHAWPGNVRELMFTLERAFVLCRTAQIGPGDLNLSESAGSLAECALETAIALRLESARPALFRDRQRWAAFLARNMNRELSTGDVAREFEISEASARIRFAALVQLGLLSAHGAKKGRRYRLCVPGPEA